MSEEDRRENARLAAEEAIAGSDRYAKLLKAVTSKRPAAEILAAAVEAAGEAKEDLSVIMPIYHDTSEALKAGRDTSEYKMASTLSKLLMTITLLAPVIDGVIAAIQITYGGEGQFGNSMWISGVSAFLQTFITRSYTRGRMELKQTLAERPVEITVEAPPK